MSLVWLIFFDWLKPRKAHDQSLFPIPIKSKRDLVKGQDEEIK